MLRIKICRVPAQSARVLAGKKILSIEEAIIEITQIFNKLKQNWLLSKRAKTKEFLDSSFSDIKFHEVFAFDIFVAIKPIYDKLQAKQQKDNAIQDNDTLKSINPFIWWKSTIGIGKDKNKYLLIGDKKSSDAQSMYCISLWTEFDPIKQQCKSVEDRKLRIESLSKINTSAVINDNLYMFTKGQYDIRNQIYTQITDMQTTSNILKTKAETAT
jgi:hypothetical protein